MKSTYSDLPNLTKDSESAHFKQKKDNRNVNIIRRYNYCFIFNNQISDIEYVSESMLDVLGYSVGEFNLDKLISIIHPDDLEYCKECDGKSKKVNNNLSYVKHFRYSFQYSYRVKTSEDIYITIQQREEVMEVDKSGNVFKSVVMHEKVNDYDLRPIDDFKIYDKLKARSINIPNKYKLTKRELEILELVYQGYKSSEISEMLYLSKFTVNTHRKNILQKTASNSWVELVKKSKE